MRPGVYQRFGAGGWALICEKALIRRGAYQIFSCLGWKLIRGGAYPRHYGIWTEVSIEYTLHVYLTNGFDFHRTTISVVTEETSGPVLLQNLKKMNNISQ